MLVDMMISTPMKGIAGGMAGGYFTAFSGGDIRSTMLATGIGAITGINANFPFIGTVAANVISNNINDNDGNSCAK